MERRRAGGSPGRGWSAADTILLAIITTGAGLLRLVRVATPPQRIFDEHFYAVDACLYVDPASACRTDLPVSKEHPPLAKWLMAGGVKVFGNTALGWRIASVVAGTLTVLVVYLLARKLLRSTLAAALASGLLGLDFLHFVQSRIAMLDVFVTLFGTAAVLFAVHDRARILRRGGDPPPGRRRFPLERPWRLAAGAACGAAVASKWSGVFAVATVVVLTLAWETRARRDAGVRGPLARALREEGPSMIASFGVLAFAVYVASFAGRLEGSLLALPWTKGSWYWAFVRRQAFMLDFHGTLKGVYPYTSPAWSWFLIKRPVLYFFEAPGGRYQEILALGNPFVWWPSLAALGWVFAGWIRRRDPSGPEGVIVAGFLLGFAPWLALGVERTFTFIFYVEPVTPFMCLALAAVAVRIARPVARRAAVAVIAAVAAASFAFFYPVMAAMPLGYRSWESRILFDDCAGSYSGDPTQRRPTLRVEGPPPGWCWI